MNGRLEERLARLAFGDISEQEARELEALALRDESVAKRLAEYRSLRSDLRGLSAAVPEDQLSRERLRDAILKQGLQPAKDRGFAWLWPSMATVAAACAFVVFVSRPSGSVEPRLVLGEEKLAVPQVARLTVPSSNPIVTRVPSIDKAEIVPVSKPVRRPAVAAKRSRAVVRKAPIVIDSRKFVASMESTHDEMNEKSAGRAPEATLVAQQSSPSVPARAPIVLIDSHRDESTGASAATEVGTASNVLVGG